ncbi:MAG: threonine/serine dehydratase [Nitrososphaerota archaeon]
MSRFRIPTFRDVCVARRIVSRYLKPTPLVYSRKASRILGCDVYFKLENLQPVRAFKVRGGVYYMYRMREEAARRGVVTASTGNHAQSIAYAGSLFGVDVKIVMPHGVPQIKIEAVKDLGAEVIIHGSYFEESRMFAERLAEEKGYLFVHSINEPLLYEGVGSMHLEVLEELPDVDVVINPLGGGSGVASGCIVYKTVDPSIMVFAVQAEGAPAFYESWRRGELVDLGRVSTRAEGLAAGRAYELPFMILRGRLNDVLLVSDAEMEGAVRFIFDAIRQVAELSGAASTAAAFKIRNLLEGKRVVLMVTGGNIDADSFASILKGGSVKQP